MGCELYSYSCGYRSCNRVIPCKWRSRWCLEKGLFSLQGSAQASTQRTGLLGAAGQGPPWSIVSRFFGPWLSPVPPSLQSAAGFCCSHPSQQCFLLRTIFVCFLLRFLLKFISLVRASSRLPNRFLPFPHGSHVLLGVRGPRAPSRPGAGRPSARLAERVQDGGGAMPACQSRRPCPGARSRRRPPHTYCTGRERAASGARAAREGARREAGRQPRRAPAHWGCFSQSCS